MREREKSKNPGDGVWDGEAYFKAFLVVWSVYLERDVQGSFKKMKIHRSYMGTSLRRGTVPP